MFYKNHKSSIDLVLTNRSSSFQLTQATETEIRDVHLIVSTFMKAKTIRLKPKKIVIRDYKHFDEQILQDDLQSVELSRNSDCPNENYNYLTCRFLSTINYHPTSKTKIIQGNNAQFTDKRV